jgi:hypothetical protein
MSRANRILTEKPSYPEQTLLNDSELNRDLASVFLDGFDVVTRKTFSIYTADLTKSYGRYGSQYSTSQAGTASPWDTSNSSMGSGYTGPLSISALCKITNVLDNGLFSVGDSTGSTSAGLGIKTSVSGGTAYIRAVIFINSTTPVIATSAIVPDGAFHSVTATWDGANVITLYLDGEIIATQTGATACYLPNYFTIGAFGGAGGSGEVALATYHKRCLTPPEVRSLAYRPWQIFKRPEKRQKTVPAVTVTSISATLANAVGSVVSTSTSTSAISTVLANAVGSVVSASLSVSTLTAALANAVGSVASVSTSTSAISATTENSYGEVSTTSTSTTSLTAVSAGATGSVGSVSTSTCSITATTEDVVGNVVSISSATTITATTAQVTGSINSVSVTETSIVAETDQLVGSIVSISNSETSIAGEVIIYGNVNTSSDAPKGFYASFSIVRIGIRRVRVIQHTEKRRTRFIDSRVHVTRVLTRQKTVAVRNQKPSAINIR